MWPGRLQNQQGKKKTLVNEVVKPVYCHANMFSCTICEYTVSPSNKLKSCLSSLHCHSSFILNYLRPNLLYESLFFLLQQALIHQSVKVSHKMQLVSLSHIYEDILPPCGHLFVTSVMGQVLRTPHNFGVFTN